MLGETTPKGYEPRHTSRSQIGNFHFGNTRSQSSDESRFRRRGRGALHYPRAACSTAARRSPSGAYTGTVAWYSRDYYLTVVVPLALRFHPDVPQRCGVAVDALRRFLRVHAKAADHRTGRGVILSDAQIAEQMGYSDRQVRRCRDAAKQLGLYHVAVQGRHCTREERLALHRAGSDQRTLANEAALVIPRWMLPHLTTPRLTLPRTTCADAAGTPDNKAAAVDDVLPPVAPKGLTGTCRSPSSFEQGSTAAATRPAQKTPPNTPLSRTHKRSQPAEYWLADDLKPHVLWLDRVHPQRIAPRLVPFARAGWTGPQLADAMTAINERLGWTSPTSDQLRHGPWCLLGWYLDQLDPINDHPGLVADLLAGQADQRTQTEQRRAVDLERRRSVAVPPDTDTRYGGLVAYRAARAKRRKAAERTEPVNAHDRRRRDPAIQTRCCWQAEDQPPARRPRPARTCGYANTR